ncbi:hypothetical protein BGW42_002806 [Actinomortierella wolfii]|nr:hypothetical protein BGW42_002806 [Actinomortierella wolfii]
MVEHLYTASLDMTDSKATDTPAVDRERLCPFLLRMYYHVNSFHRVDQFTLTSTPPAQEELQLYTWKNATLGEIATLVQQAIPEVINQSPQAQQLIAPSSQRRSTQAGGGGGGSGHGRGSRPETTKYVRLQFRVLSLDRNRATYVARDVGTVYLEPEVSAPSPQQHPSSPSAAAPSSPQNQKSSDETKTLNDIEWTISTTQPSKALEKTLESISFVTGDYIDIAIMMRSGDQPPRGGARPSGIDSGGAGPISGGGGGRDRRRNRDRDRHRGGRDRDRDRRRDDRPPLNSGGGARGVDRFAGRLGALNPEVDGDWKRAQQETFHRR